MWMRSWSAPCTSAASVGALTDNGLEMAVGYSPVYGVDGADLDLVAFVGADCRSCSFGGSHCMSAQQISGTLSSQSKLDFMQRKDRETCYNNGRLSESNQVFFRLNLRTMPGRRSGRGAVDCDGCPPSRRCPCSPSHRPNSPMTRILLTRLSFLPGRCPLNPRRHSPATLTRLQT